MSIKLAIFLVGIAGSVIQSTHRWVVISRAPSAQLEVDTASVVTTGGILRVWTRLRLPAHKLVPSGRTSDRAIIRMEIQCLGAKSRTVAMISYDSTAVVQFDNYDDVRFSPIRPHSIEETVFRYLCARHAVGPQ